MSRPLTRTHMAAADSFFSNYIKDQKSLSPFCLVHCLQSRTCSSSHDERKGQEEEEEEDKLNQSSLSVSLFESPYLKPHPLPAHQMRTPSNNVATPLTLQVDRVERVWSPTMATPTPKLTRVSLMSDLGTSCSSIDQSEREEEEGGGGGGGGQEREVRFKERARIQGSELIVRRLFHSQPDAAPVSPSNLLSHDIDENDHMTTNIDLNSTHNSMELFLDEEELNSSPQLLPGGLEHSPILLEHVEEEEMEEGKEDDDSQHFNDSNLTQGTQATPVLKTNGSGDDISPCKGSCEYNCLPASEGVGTKTDALPVKGSCVAEKSSPILSARGISLDVLFMSNSQLDDMETKGTSQDEKLKHPVTEKVGEVGGADENQDPQILRLSETPPLKRPHSPDPLILNKKSKSLQARPRFEATPTTVTALSDNQPIRKIKVSSSAASVGGRGYYQTPLSRPRVPSSCFKAPRSKGEVSEGEERTSTERALANFNPLSTSTPSVTKGSGVRSLFKTGSGKDLMISDCSIEKAKLIFDDDEDKVNGEAKSHRDQGEESGCGPEDSEGWTIPSDFDWDEFNTFTQLPSERGGAATGVLANQTEVAIVTKPAPNVGFKSASGRGLTISSKALSFASHLLSDIDEARATPILATPTPITSTANRTGPILNEAVPNTRQTGFTTASGRAMPISSKALENAKRLLSEDDSDAPPTTATPLNQFGFTTASGKSISVSSKSLKVAKELFKDDEAPPTITTLNRAPNLVPVTTPTVTLTNHLGFTTASGKKVTVSGKSLSVVRELLSEEAPPITAHTTASRVGVCSEVTTPTKHAPPINIGFTTASGKRVNVSEKSLKAVKGIFSDDETPPPEAPPPVTLAPPTMSIGFTTASGKTVPISEKALEAVKGFFAEDEAPPSGTLAPPTPMDTLATPTNIGFTTASGKEVPVSREALQAVRGLLADTEISLPLAPPTHELAPPTSIGFTTASGKNVAISEKSFQAVKGIFSDTETPPTVVTPILAPPTNKLGFTTGSGKEVRVSDESLKTIRKLFSDDNTPEAPPTRLVGFTTAGGKGVAISSESLEVAKSIFDDDHLNDEPTSTFEVPGPSAAATTGSATGSALGPTTPISSDPTTREESLGNAVSTPNLRDDFRATPLAPPNKFPERSDLLRRRVTNRKGRFSRPEGLLCDRSKSFKAKRAICQENEVTPTTMPSHLKFQKGTPSSLSSNYRRPKRVSPVWEGDLANSRKRQQQTTPPPSSPLFQLTPSQLSSLTNTSPLSPGTLNSSRLNINDTPINAPPPPLMLLSPGQEVQRQEGTIATARGRSRCQRVPLVSTATVEGGVGGYSEEELLSKGVCPSVLTVSAANASGFVFEGSGFFSPASLRRGWVCVGDGVILKLTDNNRAGVEELWNSFSLSPGVDSSLISKEWFINHYRWVMWKLAAMEVCFPNRWAGRCLTVDWCLMQLKYRYDTEIDQAKRSIIHKICEGDDTPTRHMILCVCHVTSESNENNEAFYSLELTDGWYSIPAKLDRPLSSFVGRGLVCVGGKLAVFGAEISGDPTNGHPLEVSKGKHLLLSANSVRRAHWSARLGLLPRPLHTSFPLGSIVAAGGVVPAIEVVIARRYPVLYVEKAVEGDGGGNGGRGGSGRVFRRRHEEERVEREWEERRQKKMENIYERIERQFKEEEEAQSKQRKRRSSRVSVRYVKQLQDGEEIYNQLQSSSDPDSFMELLSSTQRTLLESYQVAMATKKQEEFQSRLKKAVDQAGDELPPTRNVSQLLRLVLVQYGESPSSNSCVLNAWNVGGSELREDLKEGVPVRITKATANSSYHEGQLQLSSGKLTSFSLLPKHQPHMINYTQRQFTSLCVLSSSAHGGGKRLTFQYNEIDTVGLVVTALRQRQTNSDKTVNILYLTDADRCLLVIKAWEGLKSVTPEGVVIAGCLVAVSNLRYQVGSGLGPPTGHVTDRTLFSQRPLEEHLSDALTELKRNLPINLSQYLQEVSDAISESVM